MSARTTLLCPCCDGLGWTAPGLHFECGLEHHAIFDFAGIVAVECPHCADDAPAVPLGRTFGSQLDADLHVAGQWFAMRAVGVHFTVDGVHKGEVRQRRALAAIRRGTKSASVADYDRVAA